MSYAQGSITYNTPSSSGGGSLPGVTVPLISFTVGDGQAGTPVDGSTALVVATLQGQSLVDKQLLVVREGIELKYSSMGSVQNIKRYNSGGLGGFYFDPAAAFPLAFYNGEHFDVFITGINSTVQT
jgi:hypothetical protein